MRTLFIYQHHLPVQSFQRSIRVGAAARMHIGRLYYRASFGGKPAETGCRFQFCDRPCPHQHIGIAGRTVYIHEQRIEPPHNARSQLPKRTVNYYLPSIASSAFTTYTSGAFQLMAISLLA